MKIITIGDIHGNPNWINVVEKEQNFDKIVFAGDYVDTHLEYTSDEQKVNLQRLLKFKEDNFDKVILLYGNHDHHYNINSEHYSGFQNNMFYDFNIIYKQAIKDNLIQVIFEYDNYLFSHAGVSKTWCLNNNIKNVNEINDYLQFKPSVFNFCAGENYSDFGDDITQSPIWVRPNSLILDSVDKYVQVVGHTANENIEILENHIFIDCFNASKQYLVINDEDYSIEYLL